MQDETRVEVIQGLDAAWAWIEHLPQGDTAQEHLNAIDAARDFLLAFAAPPAGERSVFADLATGDVADSFADDTIWILTNGTRRLGALTMGDLRRAARLSHPHHADREAIARVIDPPAFGDQEILRNLGASDERPQRKKAALAKADAILALSPTPSAGRDGSKTPAEKDEK